MSAPTSKDTPPAETPPGAAPPKAALTEEQQAIVDEVAANIVRRRLAVPAMMFLEMSTPMNMLGASALHMASPLWRSVVPGSRIDGFAHLLEKREAIPSLLSAIDEAEERRRREAKKPSDPKPPEASS